MMRGMVHGNITFSELTTDNGNRSISFSAPTIFNSLGCNKGLNMVLQISEFESLMCGKLATLNHLIRLSGVVQG
jgi:hypothetical protein